MKRLFLLLAIFILAACSESNSGGDSPAGLGADLDGLWRSNCVSETDEQGNVTHYIGYTLLDSNTETAKAVAKVFNDSTCSQTTGFTDHSVMGFKITGSNSFQLTFDFLNASPIGLGTEPSVVSQSSLIDLSTTNYGNIVVPMPGGGGSGGSAVAIGRGTNSPPSGSQSTEPFIIADFSYSANGRNKLTSTPVRLRIGGQDEPVEDAVSETYFRQAMTDELRQEFE